MFSDSRSRAAKLALEMSRASDYTVSRQLFALAAQEQCACKDANAQNLDRLYGFYVSVLLKRKLRYLVVIVVKQSQKIAKVFHK